MQAPNTALSADIHHLYKLATGFWASGVLFAAIKLDLFNKLGENDYTLDTIARKIKANKQWTEKLLLACTALGLLVRQNGRYKNSHLAAAYLLEGKPYYQGDLFKHLATLWNRFGSLDSTIATGNRSETMTGGNEWILSSHSIAISGYAELLARQLDLSNRSKLCDIGGGTGTYSAVLCLKYPHLQAVIVEDPEVVPLAKQFIARLGLEHRIEVRPCKLLYDEYGSDYDVALISGVLHGLSERNCKKLLSKAHRSLRAEGLLILQEILLDEDDPQPLPALFSLNMTLGASYSEEQLLAWLYATGFIKAKVEPIQGGLWLNHIITAIRP
ncbi:MAG: methyltransferase [Acidobacteriota bacterium]|nr:acetylserotonin O-methyltransferase [Blastocatellia bacterium]MDW8412998.1 methyltransferase [Acidobacteriota bacterium]